MRSTVVDMRIDQDIKLGLRFGSYNTVALVWKNSQVYELQCLGHSSSMRSMVVLDKRGENVAFVKTSNEANITKRYCYVTDLALLLSDNHTEINEKFYLPYKIVGETLENRTLDVSWRSANKPTVIHGVLVKEILKEFFKSLLLCAKGENSSGVCVCIAVPHYIKGEGRNFLKKIVLEAGFKECNVHKCYELVPFAIQAEQISTGFKYTVTFDMGYHHTSVTISYNYLIAHKKHYFFGVADIVCAIMLEVFDQLKQKYSNLTTLEEFDTNKILELRNYCTRVLVELSSSPLTKVDIEDIVNGESFEFEYSQYELNKLIDKIYNTPAMDTLEALLTQEKLDDCVAVIIGSATQIPYLKQKIEKMVTKHKLVLNEQLVKNRASVQGAIAFKFSGISFGSLAKENVLLEDIRKLKEENVRSAKQIKELDMKTVENMENSTKRKYFLLCLAFISNFLVLSLYFRKK